MTPATLAARLRRLFWAAYARVYDLAWDTPLTWRVADEVARNLGAVDHLVDVGSGTGLIAAELRRRGSWVLGADASTGMNAVAVRRGRIDAAVRVVGERLPLADGVLQGAVAVNLMHVHPDPGALVAELGRVVGPGGTVVVVWPTDRVSLTRLALAERRLGASRRRVAGALVVRLLVGVPGLLLRVRRLREAALLAAVAVAAGSAGLDLEEVGDIGGCQRVLVLRRTADDRGSEPCGAR